MRINAGATILLVGLTVVACNVFPSGTLTPLLPEQGAYAGVAWLTDSQIAILSLADGSPSGGMTSMAVIEPGSEERRPLDLPPRAECLRTSYLHPMSLPDGRLGLIVDCSKQEDAPTYSVAAVQLPEGQPQDLLIVPFRPARVAFNPDLTMGLVAQSSRICAGITGLTDGQVHDIDVFVGEGEQRFGIDTKPDDTDECSDDGRADFPAWSPDGRQIAFFASPESIGKAGVDRLRAPWELYVMDAVAREPEELLSNVLSPYALAWSPESDRLAFSGEVRGQGEGIWLIDPQTGDLSRLYGGTVLFLAWSPDGTQIAAIVSGAAGESTIGTIDVQP
jgi:WD40 repeat protein